LIQDKVKPEEMRTIFTILFFSTISLTAYPQFAKYEQTTEKQKTEKGITTNAVTYRLFPTENMWTFIKLNTRNGQMWQVQYSVKGGDRFETFLSLLPLVSAENETNDRFTLYPTQNIYTFILLDQVGGKVWQVQWSIEPENRGIVPIN
jgi:uncharacterized membrane protein